MAVTPPPLTIADCPACGEPSRAVACPICGAAMAQVRPIHILRADGTYDDVDETELVKTEGVVDDDNEYTTWVEYRFPGADRIVHRSAHVTLKKWPEGLGGIVGSFT